MDEIFKITKNEEEVKALANMAKERFEDIKTEKKTFKIVQEYYEVVKELITAIMYRDGYKTLSHKKLIEYIKDNYEFESSEILLIDDLRKLRNNLLYYGKSIDDSYLKNHEGELKRVIEKLFGILDVKVKNSENKKEGFISIQEAMDNASKKKNVAVRGWVYRERGSNKMKFIVLRDSTNIIQCVLKKEDFSEEIWEQVDKLKIESSVEFIGEIKKDDRAPTGFEISVSDVKVIHIAEDFPINKDLNEELLGDRRHLWLRSRKMTAILKIRSSIFGAIHEYFRDNGFYEFQSPELLGAAGESGSSVFQVDYFGKKMYLAQTWQLHAETAIFALEKIYCIAPSFRAEKSNTSRHLTEYWHAEMEEAWTTFERLQNHAESLMKHIVERVLEKNKKDLEILERDVKTLEATVKKKFPRMSYTEVLELLKEKFDFKIPWGKDLRTVEEDKLSELFDTPVIVTDYPKAVKAFYMKESPETLDKPEKEKTVQGFDLIGPEGYGELFGASQREEDIEIIKKNLVKEGEDLDNYEFYFDSRRYGSIPHGGFGMGVERVISWICGLSTIKDAIPFPRTMKRVSP